MSAREPAVHGYPAWRIASLTVNVQPVSGPVSSPRSRRASSSSRPRARRSGVDQAERVDDGIDLGRARERRLDARERRDGRRHAQPRSTRLPGTMSSRPSGQRTQAL